MPHITEEIYQDYFVNFEKTTSIHNTVLGKISFEPTENIIELGDAVCDIVSAVRRYKSENGMSIKDELENITVSGYPNGIKDVEYDIKAVCHINNITYVDGEKSVNI